MKNCLVQYFWGGANFSPLVIVPQPQAYEGGRGIFIFGRLIYPSLPGGAQQRFGQCVGNYLPQLSDWTV